MMMLIASLIACVMSRPALAQNAPPVVNPDQGPSETPAILEEVGIEDKASAMLPRDVELTGSDGRSFVLGEYMDAEKPLILVLAYYRCPMLCSMVLRGVDKAIAGMSKEVGKDYRVLVVSFDSRDTTDVAREKRANYLADLGDAHPSYKSLDVASYEYATASDAEVKRIADTVGFHYRWDAQQKQYAHAAGIFVITPKGKLSQALTGIQFDPADVDKAITEADKETWHSPLKSVLLYCFNYDSKHGRYVPIVMNIMKIGTGITIAVVAFIIFRLFRAERRRAKKRASPSSDSARPSPGEPGPHDSIDHASNAKALS
jgi:protein SCO1